MKTFCVTSLSNYGLVVHIINADSETEAEEIALEAGAWEGCTAYKIDTEKKGCVFEQYK